LEKRRTERVESVNLVSIETQDEYNQLTAGQLARTLDISTAGAKIEITSSVPFSIPVHEGLMFTIALGEKVIPVQGRVVHEKKVSVNQVILGIEFTEVLPEDRKAIADFLRG
jgi:c-di-GMP-binding flagellar brake protein YcgR